MPGLGKRYWADRTPARQRPTFATLRGDHEADVVIIGGGLTGCTAASVLASAGLDVVLVEADRLASGATAGSFGAILPEPDASYRDVESLAGRRIARTAWREARLAAREFTTALRKLPLKRELSSATYLVNSRTADDASALRREQKARQDAGLETPWLPAKSAAVELGTGTSGALKGGPVTLVDPVRATLALGRAAVAAGARFFERSAVKRTKFTRKTATVVLSTGTIQTPLVLVATGEPGRLFGQLRRHVRRLDGYVAVTDRLTAAMRHEIGRRQTIVTETGLDRRWLRWLPDDRALFAGALAKPAPARRRDKIVIQQTAELMYEFSLRYPVISGLPLAWGWDMPVTSTADGLPWIGLHRNYPFHFFALAFGWHGDGLAWLAARAALRHLRDETRREDDAFGFVRHL